MEKMTTCCFTGHRPKGFLWNYDTDREKNAVYRRLLFEKVKCAADNGFRTFLSGMAVGADSDFAECVLTLRDRFKRSVCLEAVNPCANQTERRRKNEIVRYFSVLQRADRSVILSDQYTDGCMLARNRYMVDRSDLVIAVFNDIRKGGTFYTIRYAQTHGIKIDTLNLRTDIKV